MVTAFHFFNIFTQNNISENIHANNSRFRLQPKSCQISIFFQTLHVKKKTYKVAFACPTGEGTPTVQEFSSVSKNPVPTASSSLELSSLSISVSH
jgi:hypothetical protein